MARRDGTAGATDHIVQFYDQDAYLLDAVAAFLGVALRSDDAAVAVVTADHRPGLEERLGASGLDLAAAQELGRFVLLDARALLGRILVDGAPDSGRFRQEVGGIVARAAQGGRRARVFGEMVALLAVDGNPAAALQLEGLWNALQRMQPFALLCAYPMPGLGTPATAELMGELCAAHSRVIPAESFAALTAADDQQRAIAALQQQAAQLAIEIAQRAAAEERLRAALAAEQRARAEAEAALRLRDEFLSIAAHELKTPVTALRGHAQLALRRFAHEERLAREHVAPSLTTMAAQAAKLARLTDQLLDLSRLDAGKLALEREPTDLVVLVKQAATAARSRSDRHTIALTAPAAVEAWADPLRLEQVLTNLLDNAIKYSPNGGEIELAVARADGMAESAVRDHGLGIPPARREHIFERFYRAHAAGHRSGLGLGLYISRQIVELHGGVLRAEFPPDGGTSFLVRLPLAAAAAGSRPPASLVANGMIGPDQQSSTAAAT